MENNERRLKAWASNPLDAITRTTNTGGLIVSYQKDLNDLAQDQWKWVESMNWHGDKRPLEYLGLIASEVGEAVNECRGEKPTERLGEELADIILRTLDMAEQFDINIQQEVINKMHKNSMNGNFRNRAK